MIKTLNLNQRFVTVVKKLIMQLQIQNNENFFDFIFLDRSLPPFPEKKLKFGEDLAVLAKEYQNKAKIVC